MIEIDARVTKDSVIVNFHDPYIDATTNGTGVLGAMTYNDSEDNAENDFWTIKLITDLYINENNETYNHDVVQGNYFFVNTGICSL